MNPFDLPGPQFLLFYTILAGIVLGALVFWRRRAELSAAPARIDLSDPYLIAYLRGGEMEVLRVAEHANSDQSSSILEKEGLSKACASYDKTLRRAQLLPDEHVTRARFVRLASAIVLLSSVAVVKILLALSAGRSNVGFLSVLTIVAIVVASVISFPRLTE